MNILAALLARPQFQRLVRYAAVSVVNVIVGEGLLVFAFAVLEWRAVVANLFAAVLAAGPAYYLSRRWVWKMSGRSHLMGEVVPFWSLALLGLAASTAAVTLAEHVAGRLTPDRALQAVVVAAAAFAAYGVVCVVRFVLLDRFVFTAPSRSAVESAVGAGAVQ
jgi:putative flippase GtrA